ncbi:MAG: hypothetical protein JNL50_07415 [Phycisphaerae bacterium]|nr:hypothetical protein [Phycisphaerae bacterium]
MSARPHVDWTRLAEWGTIRFGNADMEIGASSFFRSAVAVLDGAGCDPMPGTTFLAMCEPPIIGMFLVLVYDRATRTEEWRWVITGELPKGFLPAEAAFNQYQALSSYIVDVRRVLDGMQATSLICLEWHGPSCDAERATLERKMAVLESHLIAPARHLL